MTVAAKAYGAPDVRHPRSWPNLRRQPSAYRECAHSPIVVFERDAAPLKDLLDALLSEPFLTRMVGMRAGREELGLRGDPLVQRIARRLTVESDTKSAIEDFLDRLFVDLRPKHAFAHTESVMALLFAMKEAGVEYVRELLTPLADSKAAELSALSNFAKTLLR
jgi:hypothetical protein